MSRGVNKVIIVGNLGQDPEIRYLPNGDAVANITVATSEIWKDKNTGQEQTRTEWHRIVAFKRLAEIMGEYLKKGSKVYIEGSLRTSQWEQDGVKRYATEIVASEMQMLDSRGGQSTSAPAQNQAQQAPQSSAPPVNQPMGDHQQQPAGMDNIPFFNPYKHIELIV